MRSIFAAAVLALASIAALLAMASSAAHAQAYYGPYWYPNYSLYPPYAYQPGPGARSFRNPYDTPYSSAFTTYCDVPCQQLRWGGPYYSDR